MVKGQVAIGGYAVQNTVTREQSVRAFAQAKRWYQWYFNIDQGQVGLEENPLSLGYMVTGLEINRRGL